MSSAEPLLNKKFVWYAEVVEPVKNDLLSENVGFKIKDVRNAVKWLEQEMLVLDKDQYGRPTTEAVLLRIKEAFADVIKTKKEV